jgi:hypothetical protein
MGNYIVARLKRATVNHEPQTPPRPRARFERLLSRSHCLTIVDGMSRTNIHQVTIGLISVLLFGAGCVHGHQTRTKQTRTELAISFAFCQYTNNGQSAVLLLSDPGRRVVYHEGPHVEVWNGTAWKGYMPDMAEVAVLATMQPGSGPMTVSVPPSPARWRAMVGCQLYAHDIKGNLTIWSPPVQR